MPLAPSAPPATAKPLVWIVLYQDRHTNDRFAFLSRDAAYEKAWALVRGVFESHDRLAEFDTYKNDDELFEAWQAINFFDGELDVFDLEIEDATSPAPASPEPFILGNRYRTVGGDLVKLVEVANAGTVYETMACEAGVHRYTTRDFGRVTGTPLDNPDPRNLLPLYAKETDRQATAGAATTIPATVHPEIGFFIEEGTSVVMTEGGEGDDHLGGEHVYAPGALGSVSDIELKNGALHSVSVMIAVGTTADGSDAHVSATFHATDDAPAFPFKLAGGAS
jgi:hypothetical protein